MAWVGGTYAHYSCTKFILMTMLNQNDPSGFLLQGILRDEMGEYGLVMEVGLHATEAAAWLTYKEVASVTAALAHTESLMYVSKSNGIYHKEKILLVRGRVGGITRSMESNAVQSTAGAMCSNAVSSGHSFDDAF